MSCTLSVQWDVVKSGALLAHERVSDSAVVKSCTCRHLPHHRMLPSTTDRQSLLIISCRRRHWYDVARWISFHAPNNSGRSNIRVSYSDDGSCSCNLIFNLREKSRNRRRKVEGKIDFVCDDNVSILLIWFLLFNLIGVARYICAVFFRVRQCCDVVHCSTVIYDSDWLTASYGV